MVPNWISTKIEQDIYYMILTQFRRIVVQLYDSSKTQNAHNFGHGYATDLYFTFLRMAKKVFLVKFFWHRRDSNPRPILGIIFAIFLGPGC